MFTNIPLGALAEVVGAFLLVAIVLGLVPVIWNDKEKNEQWVKRRKVTFLIAAGILMLDATLRVRGFVQ